MQIAYIDVKKCEGHDECHARKLCPTKAIVKLDPGEKVVVAGNLCHGCGDCVSACPYQAIGLKQV